MNLWTLVYGKQLSYFHENISSILEDNEAVVNVVIDKELLNSFSSYVPGLSKGEDIPITVKLETSNKTIPLIIERYRCKTITLETKRNLDYIFYTSDIPDNSPFNLRQIALKRYLILTLARLLGHDHILMFDDNVTGFESIDGERVNLRKITEEYMKTLTSGYVVCGMASGKRDSVETHDTYKLYKAIFMNVNKLPSNIDYFIETMNQAEDVLFNETLALNKVPAIKIGFKVIHDKDRKKIESNIYRYINKDNQALINYVNLMKFLLKRRYFEFSYPPGTVNCPRGPPPNPQIIMTRLSKSTLINDSQSNADKEKNRIEFIPTGRTRSSYFPVTIEGKLSNVDGRLCVKVKESCEQACKSPCYKVKPKKYKDIHILCMSLAVISCIIDKENEIKKNIIDIDLYDDLLLKITESLEETEVDGVVSQFIVENEKMEYSTFDEKDSFQHALEFGFI